MDNEQKIEIKLRCLESAARVFQSYDNSRGERAKDVTLIAAKQFYEWVTENVDEEKLNH